MILLKSLIARFDTLTVPRALRGTDSRLPIAALLTIALLGTGCVAGKAFRQAEAASQAGNLDEAVAAYRKAVQAAPDNANYKIALQRAMIAASRSHLDKARDFEQKDQLEAALGEYRQASEYDPSNRQATAKVAELDRTIRQRVEAARPRPQIEQMRERARAASQPPALISLTTPLPRIRYNNTSLKDVLNSIADVTGINITYDREVTDRQITVQLDGATLEQALNQIMTMNQLSYKVINERSIFVFPDTPPKHAQYDEQVVRTFYVSHADATELTQILSTIIRLPGIAVQPAIVANKTSNTITVRATSSVVQIIERIIQQNDKPRAEIVIDVEILEVDRSRAKDYGLNLTDYAVGAIFSPEVSPSGTTTQTTTTTPGATGGVTAGVGTAGGTTGGTTSTNTGRSTSPTQVASPPAFNLNTISRGFSTADFYLAVPTAIVRFLESDNRTKVVAKPQLRGAEGMKLSLNLGQRIPVISTSYTPIATGGAGVNPLSSYQYQDVGVNLDMTPIVTLEGDIRLDITIDDSQVGADKTVAGSRRSRGAAARDARGASGRSTAGVRRLDDAGHHSRTERAACGAAARIDARTRHCPSAAAAATDAAECGGRPGGAGRAAGANSSAARRCACGSDNGACDAGAHDGDASGRGASGAWSDDDAGHRVGANHPVAAGTDVPRRRRPIHGTDFDHRRDAPLDAHADADIRRDEAPRPQRERGNVHARGRRQRHLHAAGEREPRRHHAGARSGRDRRDGNRSAGGGPVRRDRARQRHADGERRGDRTRRRGDGSAVRAGDRERSVVRDDGSGIRD